MTSAEETPKSNEGLQHGQLGRAFRLGRLKPAMWLPALKRHWFGKSTRTSSLAWRLTLSSAVVSLVLLIAAGLLLSVLFRMTVERNFDKRLLAVMNSLQGNIEVDDKGNLGRLIEVVEAGAVNRRIVKLTLADANFTFPLGGWYWQVTSLDTDPPRQIVSDSLLEKRLPISELDDIPRDSDGVARFYPVDPGPLGLTIRAIEQRVSIFGDDRYSFVVAGNYDEVKEDIAIFDNALILVLGLLGLGVLIAVMVQVRFGLRPLRALQRELSAIRGGRAERLEGRYPMEIEPIAGELNLLIQSNTEIVERARTQVGNLAHALKTPLSVLTNEARLEGGDLGNKVAEQARIMRDQVSMYLDRARRAARAQSLGSVTDTKDVVDAIVRTLQRIHFDKGLTVDVRCPPDAKFRGERQDLEEMLGNLLDNAFKWAKRRIDLTVNVTKADPVDGRPWIDILVGDDGPGLPPEARATALKRGHRLDETKPGSGLGLNIVSETAGMYNGRITLDRSPLGGLLAILRLPSV